MRRGTVIFLVISLIILGVLVNAFSTLIALLFEKGGATPIDPSEIPLPGSDLSANGTQLIPKIIHQTYINATIPNKWQEGQQACVDLHDDYEYILWTDEKSRDFIATEYSWFLETFDSYPFPIQRADSIRYFVLDFYGGIYIDLDDGCNRPLDPLLNYPAWLRRTVPTGISNDAMGSVPHHPFFRKVIESLEYYNRSWVLPYITVMYSTGPLFLSVLWVEYLRVDPAPEDAVRLLMPAEYKGHDYSFFNISKGSSWHGKDAQTIFWMGKHWFLLTVAGFLIAGVIGGCLWWVWSSCVMNAGMTSNGKGGKRRPWGLWRRLSGGKGRYELVERMA
ncbi:putative CSH1 catalytic subunit of a mannosylinositol phosphorylceramide (MIPC) synthase [Venustampulla echinocandica]|uniref:Putative CSH1 catalytic subunit of a mannosylinositol phosphorylceramide (MIPC) synthase n=1 Tax=Venustampulla echinocandica TaxID=2656787 RepID=A0A370TIA7_9HELO|nr:putative CSH1 catalytic subunit of a mannosylinositol phosphorylceramide (MIPC) synthase [Venustampulla echinocandica]RDL35089.1 putative CSH1 catalytic subunit of a mannosylinositol phosphorylceramide (MIPC) synthase [Venustampulla echinocandica]